MNDLTKKAKEKAVCNLKLHLPDNENSFFVVTEGIKQRSKNVDDFAYILLVLEKILIICLLFCM